MAFHSCSAFDINDLFPCVVHPWRYCLNSNEKQPISVYRGPNSFKHLFACQKEFDPQ